MNLPYDNTNGFNLDDYNPIATAIRDLLPGKWVVKISPPKRSNPANAFYWVAIIPAFKEWTGYTETESHDLLKKKFLKYEKEGIDGKFREFVRSTTDLNVKEFAQYCRKCERMAAEHGLELTEPPELVEYLKKYGIK